MNFIDLNLSIQQLKVHLIKTPKKIQTSFFYKSGVCQRCTSVQFFLKYYQSIVIFLFNFLTVQQKYKKSFRKMNTETSYRKNIRVIHWGNIYNFRVSHNDTVLTNILYMILFITNLLRSKFLRKFKMFPSFKILFSLMPFIQMKNQIVVVMLSFSQSLYTTTIKFFSIVSTFCIILLGGTIKNH